MKHLCQCGCGQETGLYQFTNKKQGRIKGEFARFIKGHTFRGEQSPHWKGGKTQKTEGYIQTTKLNEFKKRKYTYEHIQIIERVLGKSLPSNSVVHHINGDKSDNRKANLVLCENLAYHNLLHARMNALKSCKNAKWRKCQFCGQYDDPKNLTQVKRSSGVRGTHYHKQCAREHNKNKKINTKHGDFVLSWFKENDTASIRNKSFMNLFYETLGTQRNKNRDRAIIKTLCAMHRNGELIRKRMSSSNGWFNVYELKRWPNEDGGQER